MSCSMPTIETDSRGEMMSSKPAFLPFFRDPLGFLLRWPSSSDSHSMTVGEGGPFEISRRLCITFQSLCRCPNDEMSSSRRSSNFKVTRISPDISFSWNFSTMPGSKPSRYIHLATWRGVHDATSRLSNRVTTSVKVLIGRWGEGLSSGTGGTLNAVSGLETVNLGVIGDIVRRSSSSSECSLEGRNR